MIGRSLVFRAFLSPLRLAIRSPCEGLRRMAKGPILLLLASGFGCASAQIVSHGLPQDPGGLPIAVLPFVNETGSSLRRPPPRFMRDVPGPLDDPYAGTPPETVVLLLQQQAAAELSRRGYGVVPPEQVAAVLPHPPEDALEAARAAQSAGFEGPVLTGTLHRFHVTETGLLQIRLDLALVDPGSARILWTSSARRPAKISPAQNWQEILLDTGRPIFADAFGNLR